MIPLLCVIALAVWAAIVLGTVCLAGLACERFEGRLATPGSSSQREPDECDAALAELRTAAQLRRYVEAMWTRPNFYDQEEEEMSQ